MRSFAANLASLVVLTVTKNKMTATFVNLYDGQPTVIEVSGKFTSRDASIKLSDGRTLGRILRSGGDQYALEVRCLPMASMAYGEIA